MTLSGPATDIPAINRTLAARVINVADDVYRVIFVQNLNLWTDACFDGEARLVEEQSVVRAIGCALRKHRGRPLPGRGADDCDNPAGEVRVAK